MTDSQHPDPSQAPGIQQPIPAGYDVPASLRRSDLALWALVLAIPGLCFAPLGIAALVMGIVALTQIADPRRALTGRGLAVAATVMGGLSVTVIPILLMIGILLPALGAARRTARKMKNTTQIRGITQALVTTANQNGGYYPGLDRRGNPADLTVEGRFFLLLDQNAFAGDYLISPAETKAEWITGQLTTDNYSYALLDISEDNERRKEWRSNINAYAIPISDRNTGASAGAADVMSVHTYAPGYWEGSVAWNDGSAAIENTHELETQYGNSQGYQYDNIFEQSADDDAAMIHAGD
jgi:uncharacterized protein DUF4190